MYSAWIYRLPGLPSERTRHDYGIVGNQFASYQSSPVLARRSCSQVMPDGQLCRAGPGFDRPFCFAHDPERAADAAEARRLGGLRRRKEGTIVTAYDLPGLDSVEGIRRLLEIVITDAVSLENGTKQLRVIIAAASAATGLLKVGELEDRIAVLEGTVNRRGATERSRHPPLVRRGECQGRE